MYCAYGNTNNEMKKYFYEGEKIIRIMRLFNLQRIEVIINDALWTRTARVFAKCQRGMTVTLLLALAQDVAEPAEEPTQCSV